MRKTKIVSISDNGRDGGKVYHIEEMSAYDSEAWGLRALSALRVAGIDVTSIAGAGMAGIASRGFEAILAMNYAESRPMLDEMLPTIKIVTDPAKNFMRPLAPDDIEEVKTLLTLRKAWFDLHTDFLQGDAPSNQSASPQVPISSTTRKITRTRRTR